MNKNKKSISSDGALKWFAHSLGVKIFGLYIVAHFFFVLLSFQFLLGFMDDNSKSDKNVLWATFRKTFFIFFSLGVPFQVRQNISTMAKTGKNLVSPGFSICIFVFFSYSLHFLYCLLHSIWTANSQINGIKHKQRYDNISIRNTFLNVQTSS